MGKKFQKGFLKGITAVSAIFALLLAGALLVSYINPASAAVQGIITELKLTPNLTFCSATNTYTVEVKTIGTAPIRTVQLFNGTYLPGRYINLPPHDGFACGAAPAGWVLTDHPGGLPFCLYFAGSDANMIPVGSALNFTFSARTTTESNYNWSIETYDNSEVWQSHNISMTVDCTAPVTTKSFIGPFKEDICVPTAGDPNPGDPPPIPPPECRSEWIDGVTQVNLSAADDVEHNSGVNRTYWRNTLIDDEYCRFSTICDKARLAGDFHPGSFNLYTGPFYKTEESCHLLEFYSIDNMNNTEPVQTNCFFVDKTPPVVGKDVGQPSVDETNEEEVNNGWVMWSTSDKHSGTSAAKLYVLDGTQDWAGVDVPADLEVGDITSLSFWELIESYGPPRGWSVNVILGVDADGDGVFEADLDAWHIGGLQHDPSALNGDSFIEMDGAVPDPPTGVWTNTDAYNVAQWWTPNAAGNGFASFYGTYGGFLAWLDTGSDDSRVDKTDKVKLVKLVIGGSGSWNDETALVDELSLNSNVILDDITQDRFTWVKSSTPITFTCTDQLPHPSGDEELCFKVSFDQSPFDLTSLYADKYHTSVGPDGFACVSAPPYSLTPFMFNFNYNEDSLHDLEYYCKDAVEKKSETFLQWYKVDDTPPTIEKDMFGAWLGDCPSGSDLDHGDCYVADNGQSGVTVTPIDAGLHQNEVSCSYEVWWHTDEDTCDDNHGYYSDGRCKLPGEAGSGGFNEPVDIVFVKDSTHDLEIFCQDILGNRFYDDETFLVDSTPPKTSKTYGDPHWPDPIVEEQYPHWISTGTPVTLDAADNKVGVDKTYWRNTVVANEFCQAVETCGQCAVPKEETFDLTGDVSGTVTKTDNGDSFTWTVHITDASDHYGVGMAFATSIAEPDFQVWYREYEPPFGWYYQDYGTGWDGPINALPFLGITATGDHTSGAEKTFTITIPKDLLGEDESCRQFYWAVQARTTLLGKYPSTWNQWSGGSGEVSGMAKSTLQSGTGSWNVYNGPFKKPEESCHLIEYYSVDKLGNAEEPRSQCVFVDDTPPETDKTIGEPKVVVNTHNVTVCEEPGNVPDALSFSPAAVGDLVKQHNVSTFAFPGWTNFCSIGLAFDGASLYYNRCGDDRIFRVHPVTGALEAIQETGLHTEEPNAMAYDATRNGIWFGTQGCTGGGMPIYFWDFDDNSTTLMFTIPSLLINPATGSAFTGFCFTDGLAFNANDPADPLDDELWFSDDVNRNLGKFRPNGTLVAGYDATTINASLSSLSGLAIGGSNLYMGNNGGGDVFRANKDTLAFVDEFASISDRVEDMECDPKTFAPKEVMWIRHTPQGIAADDLITAHEIEPGTCGFGGTNVTCGDGIVDAGEECDDGNLANGDGCSATCEVETEPVCGNGVVEGSEECDDGNLVNGDGCSSTCELEAVCHDVKINKTYITSGTPITLSCEDGQPHPVDYVSLFYRYRVSDDCSTWNQDNWTDWIDPAGNVVKKTVYLPQDSCHQLEYYCVDALGNSEPVKNETDIVDNQPPVITKTVVGPQVGDCPPEEEGDECIIDGVTKIHVEAEDPQPHPVGGVKCSWYYEVVDDDHASGGDVNVTPPFDINFPEESRHVLTIACRDALGNTVRDVETFLVDKTPPVTHKRYGAPFFENENGEWITTKTNVTLSAADYSGPHDSGVNATYWRTTLVDDTYCNGRNFIDDDNETNDLLNCTDAPNGTTAWNPYTYPFTVSEESCHLIEFYSVDNVKKNETPRRQCAFVDDTPPVPNKTVGVPREIWNGENAQFYNLTGRCWSNGSDSLDCWKITMLTPVTLDCSDPEPHPVDHENVYFNVELDGDDATEKYCEEIGGEMQDNGYCLVESEEAPVQFHFLEESEHNLKFYCADALGNNGTVDDEKFKVEGTAFRIPLFKKWNLISVPFVLFNDDIEAVFNETKDNITSVWTYDGDTGNWFVWTPGPAPDTLHEILPGWGYWVLAKNDTELLLAGSLFSSITTPPDRNLVNGWNLIGPYGVSWQEFDLDEFNDEDGECPYTSNNPNVGPVESNIFADFAYCSLNSLVDTQEGSVEWSSLFTFVNCPSEDSEDVGWKGINACTDTRASRNKMVMGYGYWILMNVPDIYAPSSVCKKSTQCVYFAPGP